LIVNTESIGGPIKNNKKLHMKKMIIILMLGIFLACTEAAKSPTETAQIVVESFYQKEFPTLEKYTTQESFDSFMSINDIVPVAKSGASNFSVVQEEENEEIAWVKFTTSYEEQPETFKLVKEDGKWKVTEIGLRERSPF